MYIDYQTTTGMCRLLDTSFVSSSPPSLPVFPESYGYGGGIPSSTVTTLHASLVKINREQRFAGF